MRMRNLTVPFENGNVNRSVQNGTEWNGTDWSRLHYTRSSSERSEQLFLASENGYNSFSSCNVVDSMHVIVHA